MLTVTLMQRLIKYFKISNNFNHHYKEHKIKMAKFVSLLAATAIASEQAYQAAAPVQAVAAV